MTDQPHISIVVPTRNRPDHLRLAAESLWDQESFNFEVLISDNSDSGTAAKNEAFFRSKADSRTTYLRPSNTLSMVEHWEWAVSKASGRYVGILTDRMVFKRNAMRVLENTLKRHDPKTLSYNNDRMVGEKPPLQYIEKAGTGMVQKLRSDNVLGNARVGVIRRDWPRMLNCVCDRTVLEEVRAEYGSIFSGIAPDYSFCFRLLDWIPEYHHLDSSLIISGGLDVSNGRAFAKANRALVNDYIGLTKPNMADRENEILREFLFPVESRVPGNPEMFEYWCAMEQQRSGRFEYPSLQGFYNNATASLAKRSRMGMPVSMPMQELQDYRVRHRLKDNARSRKPFQKIRQWVNDRRSGNERRTLERHAVVDIWQARKIGSWLRDSGEGV